MVIGITGSLGTGKTTVAKMFAKHGAVVLDADRLGHMALRKGTPTYKRVVAEFGTSILNGNKSINKKRLASLVFGSSKDLKRLTDIVHPFVIKRIKSSIRGVRPEKIVAIDAPLLVEAGLMDIVDKLIVVKTGRAVQLYRCMKGKRIKREEAMSRIKKQLPLSKKVKVADYVVNNNGTLNETRNQVNKIWRKIKWI